MSQISKNWRDFGEFLVFTNLSHGLKFEMVIWHGREDREEGDAGNVGTVHRLQFATTAIDHPDDGN